MMAAMPPPCHASDRCQADAAIIYADFHAAALLPLDCRCHAAADKIRHCRLEAIFMMLIFSPCHSMLLADSAFHFHFRAIFSLPLHFAIDAIRLLPP
jgi:hypothetical protein